MIKYLSVIALCSFIHYSECMSIRDIRDDSTGKINQEAFDRLYDVYSSANGLDYWKADAEYLMTEDFISEYLKNINDQENKYEHLMNDWIAKAQITSSFDKKCCCFWSDDNRRAALLIMKWMIERYKIVYKAIKKPQQEDVATKMLYSTITDLIDIYYRFNESIDENDSQDFAENADISSIHVDSSESL